MKTVQGMVKINLKQSKVSYIIAGITFIAAIASAITTVAGANSGAMPLGNYLYLLPLLMAIFIPARNFSKLMNLGGKRMDFIKGCILSYMLTIVIVTLLSILLYPTIDRIIQSKTEDILNLWYVFGFIKNGAVVAFFQMSAFLFLFCCVLHTLTLIQGYWYGWVVDVLIIAIISVFTPIMPLRTVLVWFFNMIIFHDNVIVQILSCLILGTVIYCASLIPIKSKQI